MPNFNNKYTKRVLDDVAAERRRTTDRGLNEELPYACEDPNGTGWGIRLGMLGEEFGEVCEELIEPTNARNMYDELIQVAAVAVSCAESIMASRIPGQETPIPGSEAVWEGGVRPRAGVKYPSMADHDCGPNIASGRDPISMEPSPSGIQFGAASDVKFQSMGSVTLQPDTFKADFTNIRAEAAIDEHEAVLQRALAIYQNRNAEYKDIWREYGYRGSVVHLRSCVERVWRRLHPSAIGHRKSKVVDELLDSINYSVFTIRNIEADNAEGTWKW